MLNGTTAVTIHRRIIVPLVLSMLLLIVKKPTFAFLSRASSGLDGGLAGAVNRKAVIGAKSSANLFNRLRGGATAAGGSYYRRHYPFTTSSSSPSSSSSSSSRLFWSLSNDIPSGSSYRRTLTTQPGAQHHPQQQRLVTAGRRNGGIGNTMTSSSRGRTVVTTTRADPIMSSYKYWNREDSPHGLFEDLDVDAIVNPAKIISLTGPNDEANEALEKDGGMQLPPECTLLDVGSKVEDFDLAKLREEGVNVIFVSPSCPQARRHLPILLKELPSIKWVHLRSAGIDFITSDELSNETSDDIYFTNAKGQFSSTLAEYTMMACSYFAKDLPRLLRQKKDKHWDKYNVEELRGKTMGIVGYGDIGRACAKLAHVYGMRIVALRRNPKLSAKDPLCDKAYGNDKQSLNALMSESDYIVCSAPSTMETQGMVNAYAFDAVKENAVFINLGRGPVVDEDALIQALKCGKLKGAALDVFAVEPLPKESELWELDNVLISPHNMDQTATFMHEATEFFVNENLPRFLCGEILLNRVDKVKGY